MRVNVHMFAVAREWAGRDTVEVDLPAGASVATLRTKLAADLPQLNAAGSRIAVAVNDNYATEQTIIEPNDSIALIPPVSGG